MHRLVIALVALLGLTGAAVVAAYLFLVAAGTDRAARLTPADAIAYVNVYLQPSAGQQMNLSALIGRLPGFADEASLDEKVDQIAQNLLAGTGIDYRADLEPWLGNQLAAAVWNETGSDEPAIVLFLEVEDRDAAEASVPGLVADDPPVRVGEYEGVALHEAETSTYAFVEEMVVIGPDADAVRAVIDVSRGAAALGDRDDFTATLSDLPSDHLAAAFVDLAAAAQVAEAGDSLAGVSTAGAVLVAEPDGLRLTGGAPYDERATEASASIRPPDAGEPSRLAEWMPPDTVAELVVFGLRQTLEEAEAAAASTSAGEDLLNAVDTLRAVAALGLGIDLDADVLPLLEGEVGIAISGFDGEVPSGQLLLRPDDPARGAASLERVVERLGAVGATVRTEEVGAYEVTVVGLPDVGEVAYAVSDGTIIIGLGVDHVAASVEAHADGASLAASEAYRRTFELAGTRAGNEAFVDVGAVVDLMEASGALTGDVRDILGQLGSFGATSAPGADRLEFHAVLTVEEAGRD